MAQILSFGGRNYKVPVGWYFIKKGAEVCQKDRYFCKKLKCWVQVDPIPIQEYDGLIRNVALYRSKYGEDPEVVTDRYHRIEIASLGD